MRRAFEKSLSSIHTQMHQNKTLHHIKSTISHVARCKAVTFILIACKCMYVAFLPRDGGVPAELGTLKGGVAKQESWIDESFSVGKT